MKELREIDIYNKGLDWVRAQGSFMIKGNHYYPYPGILSNLSDDFSIETEYFGNSDQGSTKTYFKKRDKKKELQYALEKDIREIENKYNIKITYIKI